METEHVYNKKEGGARLRAWRELRGWDTARTAELIGVHTLTLNAIELGKNSPSADTIIKLYHIGLDIGWFLTGERSVE